MSPAGESDRDEAPNVELSDEVATNHKRSEPDNNNIEPEKENSDESESEEEGFGELS